MTPRPERGSCTCGRFADLRFTVSGRARATCAASCGSTGASASCTAAVRARPSIVNVCLPCRRRGSPRGSARSCRRTRRDPRVAQRRGDRGRERGDRRPRPGAVGRSACVSSSARPRRTAGVSRSAWAAAWSCSGRGRRARRSRRRSRSTPRGSRPRGAGVRPARSHRLVVGAPAARLKASSRRGSAGLFATAAAAASARFGSRNRPLTPPGPLRCTGRRSSFSS